MKYRDDHTCSGANTRPFPAIYHQKADQDQRRTEHTSDKGLPERSGTSSDLPPCGACQEDRSRHAADPNLPRELFCVIRHDDQPQYGGDQLQKIRAFYYSIHRCYRLSRCGNGTIFARTLKWWLPLRRWIADANAVHATSGDKSAEWYFFPTVHSANEINVPPRRSIR